jgi:hypothetical protein
MNTMLADAKGSVYQLGNDQYRPPLILAGCRARMDNGRLRSDLADRS